MSDEAFLRGVRLYNDGAFFDAHEEWEAAWRTATDPVDRALFQGLVQVTAAFYKLFVSKDRGSAQRLLSRGLAKLDGVPAGAPGTRGLDLEAFRHEVRAALARMATEDSLAREAVPALRPVT